MKKAAALLTLATNGEKVIVPCDNIAFAMKMQEEDKLFTRVFFKIVAVDNVMWVDVQEAPEKIARMLA